jgi:hypothetical protein
MRRRRVSCGHGDRQQSDHSADKGEHWVHEVVKPWETVRQWVREGCNRSQRI